jgi:hypothetical protein
MANGSGEPSATAVVGMDGFVVVAQTVADGEHRLLIETATARSWCPDSGWPVSARAPRVETRLDTSLDDPSGPPSSEGSPPESGVQRIRSTPQRNVAQLSSTYVSVFLLMKGPCDRPSISRKCRGPLEGLRETLL